MRAPALLLLLLPLLLGAAPDEAAPAEATPRLQVLVLDLEASSLQPAEGQLLNGLVAESLSRHRSLQVLASADIRQMLDLESERQSVGCDTQSCLAEIAGAMGAQYVVHGQAGRLGDLIVVQLNLFDSARAQSVGRQRVEADDLGQLPRLIDPAVHRLVVDLLPDDQRQVASAPSPVAEPGGGPGVLPWASLGGGAGVAALGVALVVVGLIPAVQHQQLQGEIEGYAATPTPDSFHQAAELQTQARAHQQSFATWGAPVLVAGALTTITGLAAAGAGAVWLAFGEAE